MRRLPPNEMPKAEVCIQVFSSLCVCQQSIATECGLLLHAHCRLARGVSNWINDAVDRAPIGKPRNSQAPRPLYHGHPWQAHLLKSSRLQDTSTSMVRCFTIPLSLSTCLQTCYVRHQHMTSCGTVTSHGLHHQALCGINIRHTSW